MRLTACHEIELAVFGIDDRDPALYRLRSYNGDGAGALSLFYINFIDIPAAFKQLGNRVSSDDV